MAAKKTASKKRRAAKKTATEGETGLVISKETVKDLSRLLKETSLSRQSRKVCVA
jgi:hypothetical protein